MNVLSLFNGMGCIWLALDKLGIPVEKRYSSEIDKYATIVNDANYPDTIQLGDIRNVHAKNLEKIDLIVGGSPCQGFSFAGKGLNFDDPRSALFFEFVRLLKECRELNPDVLFLLENVKMKHEHEIVISKYLNVAPITINSALVSAQNRVRLYWTNIYNKPYGMFGDMYCDIPQPADKGILLKDILQPPNEVDEKYYLSEKGLSGMINHKERNKENGNGFGVQYLDENKDKSNTLLQRYYKDCKDNALCVSGGNHSDMDLICVAMRGRGENNEQQLEENKTGKTNSLTSVQKDNLLITKNYVQWDGVGFDQDNRAYFEDGKSGTLDVKPNRQKTLLNNSRIRRLTPIECERLQTVPMSEKSIIFALCLDQIKNYVNVVNKCPKLRQLVGTAEKTQLNESVKNAVLSMNVRSQSIKHTAQKNVDMQTEMQIKECTKHNQLESNTIAGSAENCAMCKNQNPEEVFADQNVFINITEGKIIKIGLEELPLKDKTFTTQKNGKIPLKLYGKEIMQLVEDVEKNLNTKKDNNFIYITSHPLSIKNLEQILITYYLFAKNVIDGYIQSETQQNSLSVRFNISDGYTAFVSDSQRYKMLGNGWTVDVIAHILSFMEK